MGVSRSYVIHLSHVGKLPTPRYEGRRPWYDAERCEAFLATWKRQRSRNGTRKNAPPAPQRGPIASKAFPLIEAGADWRALVVQLEIDPVLARELVREYATTPEEERDQKRRERVEKEERVKEREHARKKRIEDLKAHQVRLVREAKSVTIALPAGSAPENAR